MRSGLILQHDETAPADLFADWLESRSIPFEVRRVWELGAPEDPRGWAWICSLGSDQTPRVPSAPGWVEDEVGFLGRALQRDVPVLGLCFGGQALAAAAGARIHTADPPEFGWIEIESARPELISPGPWLYFHYDQLELPSGATELARSPAGTAAFSLGRNLGLQFHPETTPGVAAAWAASEHDRLEGLGVGVAGVSAGGEALGERARAGAYELFDAWWAQL